MRVVPLAFVALSATACGAMFPPSGKLVPLNSPPRPLTPRAPESVTILSGATPTEPFVEVGLVEVSTRYTGDQDMTRLMAEVRNVAANSGCDALYNLKPHDRAFGDTTGFRGYQATCIVYRAAPDTAAAPMTPPSAPAPVTPASASAPVTSASASAPAGVPGVESQACKAAEDYDNRARIATSPAKEQLAKLAASKHNECDSLSVHP